jgi:hypothetical protein
LIARPSPSPRKKSGFSGLVIVRERAVVCTDLKKVGESESGPFELHITKHANAQVTGAAR